jgi:hypothetical protein
MAFVANSPPNYASAISSYGAAIASGPVATSAVVPLPVFSQVTGVFNMVFAYGESSHQTEFHLQPVPHSLPRCKSLRREGEARSDRRSPPSSGKKL